MTTTAFFVIVVVVVLAVHVPFSLALFHDEEERQHDAVVVAHDMIRGESSSSIGIPASPSCWATAIGLLGPVPGTTDAASFCAHLPEASQKRLALELARCHLDDIQKPLFRNHRTAQECGKTSAMPNNEALRSCLVGLTDAGEHAYSHYMPYLQALCTRKTQELFLRHQQSIKDGLAAEYVKMSRASIEQMESVHRATAQHAEELNAKLAEIPIAIQNQLSEQLGELMRKELGDRLALAMQERAEEQSLAFAEILGNIQLQNLQRQQQHDDWAHYQSGMFLKQAREMERQRDALRESRERIEDLSSKVSKASTNMQPLVGLEAFMKAATEGYSWISFLLYFLATFNVVWVITRPQRCHRFRMYLFAVVLTEAAMELALKGGVTHGLITEMDRLGLTTELRRLALLLECITYVVGLLMSFLAASTDAVDKERILEALMDRRYATTFERQPVYHEYEDFAGDDETPQYSQQQSEIHDRGYPPMRSYERPVRTRLVQRNHDETRASSVAGGRIRNGTVEGLPPVHYPRHLQPVVQVDSGRLSHCTGEPPIVSPRSPKQQQHSKSSNKRGGSPPFDFDETIEHTPPPAEEAHRPTKITNVGLRQGTRRRAAASPPDNEPNSKKVQIAPNDD